MPKGPPPQSSPARGGGMGPAAKGGRLTRTLARATARSPFPPRGKEEWDLGEGVGGQHGKLEVVQGQHPHAHYRIRRRCVALEGSGVAPASRLRLPGAERPQSPDAARLRPKPTKTAPATHDPRRGGVGEPEWGSHGYPRQRHRHYQGRRANRRHGCRVHPASQHQRHPRRRGYRIPQPS